MEKYTTVINVGGYNYIDNLADIEKIKESIIVFVIVEKMSMDYSLYYNKVKKAMLNGNKVILISDKQTEEFKRIASLMGIMCNYNIYTVSSTDDIDSEYLDEVIKREPDYVEAMQYVNSEIASYSEMEDILKELIQAYSDSDYDTKELEYKYSESIDVLMDTIYKLKKDADMANSGELVEKIKELNDKMREESVSNGAETLNEALAKENKELKDKLDGMVSQVSNGSSVISYYSEVNMSFIQHKIQRILYFKEISYVKYTHSLINSILTILGSARKLKVKLVIYDNNSDMYDVYTYNNGAKIVNTNNYSVSKQNLTGSSTCLITEPNQAITKDLLQDENGFDVLIIYDKMHKYENIISGNNVTRVIVSSSGREIEAVAKKLNISISDMILTVKNSSIYEKNMPNKDNIFDIPSIDGYNEHTDSAKVSKYSKATSSDGNKIFEKIFKASNINALFG